ncbi:MAG TPA: hypothetical protein VH247_10510 [Thermoleophilaceae bacterium]|nr:hypothetical protein [Thermoleophilaceae bacterium]
MRHTEGTRQLVLVIAAALTLAACGGSTAGDSSRATSRPPKSPATTTTAPQKDYTNYYPPGTHKASRKAVAIITAWSDELRAGHVKRAASYFDVPALVQNATPPMRLHTKKEVLAFNQTLPCGVHIVKTLAAATYTVATFVLTERPGSSGCGATGKLAAAAFLLHHGKIVEWRRVLVPPPLGPARNMKQRQLQS